MSDAPRIVLTRQRERNRAWAEALRKAEIAVVELPLIRFTPLPVPAAVGAEAFDWILFSSPQAVAAFADSGLEPRGARLGALGAGTAAALEDAGFPVAFAPGCEDGARFAEAFLKQAQAPARILWPGPESRMASPARILAEAGFVVSDPALYRTEPVPPADLPASPCGEDDIVFFCSPSTVRAFCAAWSLRPCCVAIGETTAAAARSAGFAPRVAAAPDLDSMVQAAGLDARTLNPNLENMP